MHALQGSIDGWHVGASGRSNNDYFKESIRAYQVSYIEYNTLIIQVEASLNDTSL